MNPAIADFLAQKNIAVAGVSRKSQTQPANLIYRKLRDSGYRVFPVNPATNQMEGDQCYPNLASIPEALDGVVLATRPEVSEKVVEECITLGVPRVWMHRSFGEGSVSEKAIANCNSHQIKVIEGGCPIDVLPSGGLAPSLHELVSRAGGVAPICLASRAPLLPPAIRN